jgi:hypothetical protein
MCFGCFSRCLSRFSPLYSGLFFIVLSGGGGGGAARAFM